MKVGFIWGILTILAWGIAGSVGCADSETDSDLLPWDVEDDGDSDWASEHDTSVYVDSDTSANGDTDTDTDSDSDSDSDTDADTDTDTDSDTDTDTEPAVQPPKLRQNHAGWKMANCFGAGCHSRNDSHNAGKKPGGCATCHGRNGASQPHGPISLPCGFCHENPNDHPQNLFPKTDCAKCH